MWFWYQDDKIEDSNREVDIKVPLENWRSDTVRKRLDSSVSEIEANERGADSSDQTNLGSGILQNIADSLQPLVRFFITRDSGKPLFSGISFCPNNSPISVYLKKWFVNYK